MQPQTKREYLRELVASKNRWSRQLTDEERALGFLGWHERGYLPHCDFPGLIQLVTFRLADSMPVSRKKEWEHLLAIADTRERRAKLEEYLDRGVGRCLLRERQIATLCEDALLFFHNERYELLAWCVMPNHVHVLLHVWRTPLGKLIQSWKRHVATQAQFYLERRPPARHEVETATPPGRRRPALQALQWEREHWDTYMRDERQETKAIHYTEANPPKARLCPSPEQWPFSSARFRDDYRILKLPTAKSGGNFER